MAQTQYPPKSTAPTFSFDALYCSEEPWDQQQDQEDATHFNHYHHYINRPPELLERDLFWEDQEIVSLSSKESVNPLHHDLESDPSLRNARQEAVDWILKCHAHYDFYTVTAVLAVHYLDRFLVSFHLQSDKPWMTQLAAVACFSLAAKVEETDVPLLLDLQVEQSRFYFEPKAIQRMELLVLSTLQWKMNPVTPLSFLDYFARRLGSKHHLYWEFLTKCEQILLSVISDSRSVSYLPSVMAAAITLHVVYRLDSSLGEEFQTQLFSIVDIQKETLEGCRKLVMECSIQNSGVGYMSNKRKFATGRGPGSVPGSPIGVLDICFNPENECSSDDSWAVKESEPKKMRMVEG